MPIYAGGRTHPLRDPCLRILRLVIDRPDQFFTNAEVLQEVIHHFRATRRWREGRLLFREFTALMGERVEPIFAADLYDAANFADLYAELDARDLVHIAVMQRVGARQIVSADKGFDRIPEIERLDPARIDDWAGSILS